MSPSAVEGDAFGRRQRFALLVEHCNRLAAIAREPSIVVGINRCAKSASLQTGKLGAPSVQGNDLFFGKHKR